MSPIRRHFLLGLVAAAALPRIASAQAGTRTLRHGLGETTLPTNPRRVAVYDIAALDILDALGVEQIVGIAGNTFPEHLAKYRDRRHPRLGTLFEPDYEALAAARPDLILVGGRSAAKYNEVSRIAPTIGMHAGNADYLDRVIANTTLLGDVFAREERAAALAGRLRQSVAALRGVTAGRGRGLIVLTTGTRMSAYGPGSRFGMIHTDLGVPAAVPDLSVSLHGQSIGSEFIQQANPDWLFVVDRDAAIGRGGAARRALDNPLVRQTAAWREDRVLFLDPLNWYLAPGGIQSTQLMVGEVGRAYGVG
ncbi:siderophore ABC transporter substrate-binding protein [Roseococcus suduntuyensis]|uniref:Iron complex transport system substrate-binding protein n=1 Tax=Roseococcus suduntuyensis TaxID=455361 RepID=A0A840AJN5_9PROT|nr:siderophore ABC transporter substrate-binding protein [Roseococcus suduntuyensis]MBB3900324.1 iron complex transport system substrate-binding protein [Roseococcus suduntuyensis]